MIRKIITIDKNKCNGCGLCVDACHEGAIGLEEGKAVLLRDDYCDGLGDCLPACPMDAISFEEREALAYDEEAVKENMKKKAHTKKSETEENVKVTSKLTNFPVQIKLVSEEAYFLKDSELLIAADCTAFAYGNFHNDFMKDKVTLIGCTKLDDTDYTEKLTNIFRANNITSVTVTRMQVPCCGGMENTVKKALDNAGKELPLRVVTISSSGAIINDVNY
ncbi:MAG: 4Fe-4S dicluster domain-containing protein [Anaerofustis stercorihominis]|nr:4Fe-4S dicluster domain-containing protein [Anaerofustis stercorihominis]